MDLTSQQKSAITGGAPMIAGGLFNMFGGGWQNPADAAMPEIDKIPGMISPYYNPYIDAGRSTLPQLESQYGRLTSNPGQFINDVGASYQKSPGFDFSVQQAEQAAKNAAASGGMAGSPQHEQQVAGMVTNLANQDYHDWLSNALGMYNRGLGGMEGMNSMGYNASNEMAQNLANALLTKANLKYQGENAQNQNTGGSTGSALGGIAKIASAFF